MPDIIPQASTIDACGWCDRPGREVRPCCERGDHNTMVCADSHDCLRATQATLREQEAREAEWLAEQSRRGPRALSESPDLPPAEPAEAIAGRAILGDFQRWAGGETISSDWQTWTLRLDQHLQQAVDALSQAQQEGSS